MISRMCPITGRASHLTAAALAAVLLLAAPAGAFDIWSDDAGERAHSINATVKWTSLLSRAPADTTMYSEEWSGASLWRLRLGLDSRPRPGVRIEVAYDLSARIESDATGAGGALVLPSTLPAPYRIEQLDADVIDAEGGVSVRHELDRASLDVSFGSADLTVGRQAVGWGRGLMFSVVDIFAPFSPLESDREWRRGIDAVRLRVPVASLWSLDAVGAFGESVEESAFAVRAHGYAGDVDGELLVGSRRDAPFCAASVSLPVFDAEAHGEVAVFLEPERAEPIQSDLLTNRGPEPSPTMRRDRGDADGDTYIKALLGASRTFDVLAGLYVVAEYHYSGYGVEDPTDPDQISDAAFVRRYLTGDTQVLGRHAVAVRLSYGFAGNAPVSVTWLGSPVDGSGVIIPAVTWSFSDSITLTAQGYFAHGERPENGALGSEYGATPSGVLAQISVYY